MPGEDVNVTIANISFAFDNAKIIIWLQERGLYIMESDWATVEKYNKKIQDALKNDYLLEKFQRPSTVFVTLETSEGFQKACSYNEVVE